MLNIVRNKKGFFMAQEYIIPGSLAWESICEQCGLCCLVKVMDTSGRIWLTDVRCDMLDVETRKCKCYPENTGEQDLAAERICIKQDCCFLNHNNLHNDYLVPACCSYVQHFYEPALVKKCAQRPDIDWSKTVPESSVPETELGKHLLPGSCRYFKYNPHVNKAYRQKNRGR